MNNEVMTQALEPHYRIKEIAALWGFKYATILRWFEDEPGVLRTKWHEAHTGDKHQRRLIELDGATVRILPSLRPLCAWSAEEMFPQTIRAAEAYVWNKGEGLVGTATYSILPK